MSTISFVTCSIIRGKLEDFSSNVRTKGSVADISIMFNGTLKKVSLDYIIYDPKNPEHGEYPFMLGFINLEDGKYLFLSFSTLTDYDGMDAEFNILSSDYVQLYEGSRSTYVRLTARHQQSFQYDCTDLSYNLAKSSFVHNFSKLLNPETDILEVSQNYDPYSDIYYPDDSDYDD